MKNHLKAVEGKKAPNRPLKGIKTKGIPQCPNCDSRMGEHKVISGEMNLVCSYCWAKDMRIVVME